MNAKQTTLTSVSLLVLAVLFIALIILSNIFLIIRNLIEF